jgi:hypothetical protein
MVTPETVPEILTIPVPNPEDWVMVLLFTDPLVIPDSTETLPFPPEVETA